MQADLTRTGSLISDKGNLLPPPDDSDWYHLASIELGNGDNVGVVERWYPPDASDGCTIDARRAVQQTMGDGEFRANAQAKDWIGLAVAEDLARWSMWSARRTSAGRVE